MVEKKNNQLKYYQGIGRRKSAVAQVRLYIFDKEKSINVNGLKIKKGEMYVNGKKIEQYFPLATDKISYLSLLKKTNNEERFAISILVKGSGKKSQLQAIVHGLAKALILVDSSYKKILKPLGVLTRDAREKQRRMVGTGGKARRKKQSPKR